MDLADRILTRDELELHLDELARKIAGSKKSLLEFLYFTNEIREEKEEVKPTIKYLLNKILEIKSHDIILRSHYERIISNWFIMMYHEKFNKEKALADQYGTIVLSEFLSKRI